MNARGRILIVDDDALVRASLAELLGMDDLVVVCADGVEAGRAELSKGEFHVVLLDVYLSGSEADIPNARDAAEVALQLLGAEVG